MDEHNNPTTTSSESVDIPSDIGTGDMSEEPVGDVIYRILFFMIL